jgi:hypothetical protein
MIEDFNIMIQTWALGKSMYKKFDAIRTIFIIFASRINAVSLLDMSLVKFSKSLNIGKENSVNSKSSSSSVVNPKRSDTKIHLTNANQTFNFDPSLSGFLKNDLTKAQRMLKSTTSLTPRKEGKKLDDPSVLKENLAYNNNVMRGGSGGHNESSQATSKCDSIQSNLFAQPFERGTSNLNEKKLDKIRVPSSSSVYAQLMDHITPNGNKLSKNMVV